MEAVLYCSSLKQMRIPQCDFVYCRQLTFSHRQALSEQLAQEMDPALTLHLACVILFHKFTQCIIHIPGKCVPQVLLFLKDHLDPEKFQEMTLLQGSSQYTCTCVCRHLKHGQFVSSHGMVGYCR